MLASEFVTGGKIRNVFMRFCFILILAMPLLAQSAANPVPQISARSVVRADAHSGRLVRAVIAPVIPAALTPPPAQLKEIVDHIAVQEGVEAQLVDSVIRAESNYNVAAVSSKGALGIMQLIPSTARRFGVSNVFDAADNIKGGVRYLRFLLDYYQGDYTKSIAAYNAGESAVDKYKGVPPYAETEGYVRTVAKHLTVARQNAAHEREAVKPASSADTEHHIQAQIGPDGLIYYKTP
jgi:soluble lytic murein transglycosylase-like protein